MGGFISANDREPIWAESYPYHVVCVLDMTFDLNAVKNAGWLAGDSTILTTGHNLYDQIQDGLALFCQARLESPLLVHHLRIFYILRLSKGSATTIACQCPIFTFATRLDEEFKIDKLCNV